MVRMFDYCFDYQIFSLNFIYILAILFLLLEMMSSTFTYLPPANSSSYCQQKYGKNMSFIPESEMRKKSPPILLSQPGSGNSWTRLLVEYSTSFYTGSLEIDDKEYKSIYAGERACGIRMSAIKGHPKDLIYDKTLNIIKINNKATRSKCRRGEIHDFNKAVVIIRNPLYAIWANYQLQTTKLHSGKIKLEKFNISDWISHLDNATIEWSNVHTNLFKPLHSFFPADHLIIVKFEDFKKTENATNIQILNDIVKFLNYETSMDKLECAFKLAQKPKVHRTHTNEDVSLSTAYRSIGEKNFCAFTSRLNSFSNFFGYGNSNRPFNCSKNINASMKIDSSDKNGNSRIF